MPPAVTYQPAHFVVDDAQAIRALVAAAPFATWVFGDGDGLQVAHLPLVLDPDQGPHGTLIGHVARQNPAWTALEARLAAGLPVASVVVFQGPQAYVSPAWYPDKAVHGKVVPTWNYAVVHAHGVPRTVHDPQRLRAIVGRLTDRFEAARPQPWSVDDAPADYVASMLRAIVGIEIPVERWVGKWKMSQNRADGDRAAVADGLRAGTDPQARAVAATMDALAARRADPTGAPT